MTDIKVRGSGITNGLPFDLDINITGGASEDLCDSTGAEQQRAYIAAYMKRGSMPLDESIGVDWADFVSNGKPFTEIIMQINNAIEGSVGTGKFVPQLKQVGRDIKFSLLDLGA